MHLKFHMHASAVVFCAACADVAFIPVSDDLTAGAIHSLDPVDGGGLRKEILLRTLT